MERKLSHINQNQWDFMALLMAFNEPVSLKIAEKLSPLSPQEFITLLGQKNSGWIEEIYDGHYTLKKNLPEKITEKLIHINTPEKISLVMERLQRLELDKQLDQKLIQHLRKKSILDEDVFEYEIDLARKAVKKKDIEGAIKTLLTFVRHLFKAPAGPEQGALFVAAVMDLIPLLYHTNPYDDCSQYEKILKKASEVANNIGDKRSCTMLNLYMGWIYYHYNHQTEALDMLSLGLKEAEALGDKDILERSAPYLGMYYYIQGMFKDALPHLDRAMKNIESERGKILIGEEVFVTSMMGLALAMLGRLHDAIGFFSYHWRRANTSSNLNKAVTYRAMLGAMLLITKKYKAAVFHLEEACKEAKHVNNRQIHHIAKGSLIYIHFINGRLDMARDMIAPTLSLAFSGEMIHQYVSSHYLEMLFEFERLGITPHPRVNFNNVITNVMTLPNVHIKGIAMRLLAKKALLENKSTSKIQSYLDESETCLSQSGNTVELAKTLIEKARLKITNGEHHQADSLLREAVDGFGDYTDAFFPKDLKAMVQNKEAVDEPAYCLKFFIDRFLSVSNDMLSEEDSEEMLNRLLTFTNRLFGTERGALFMLTAKSEPRMAASYNFSKADLSSPEYKPVLKDISKCFRTRKPIIKTKKQNGKAFSIEQIQGFICIPVHAEGLMKGVLYHDSIYLDNYLKIISPWLIPPLIRQITGYVKQNMLYNTLKKERDQLLIEMRRHVEKPYDEIQFGCPIMTSLVSQIDTVAALDTTVLIYGETGVGKELFARRIHQMGQRRSANFEIVDLTAIPENLLESELFGYEKGAFTGADRQKQGRFELAHNGTLFLDEIGEIPLSFQVKLLRVLQEKSFVRIGGSKQIVSDFRLIASTNRNLEKEVAEGRFRQDLYFRLNVIPIKIPPLRERGDDIVLLARFFLNKYAAKHNLKKIELTAEDKDRLTQYSWPGNVRELENIIERTVILSKPGKKILGIIDMLGESSSEPDARRFLEASTKDKSLADYPTLDDIQRQYIRLILEKTGGKKYGPSGAAKVLGLKRTTLHERMKRLGIRQSTL